MLARVWLAPTRGHLRPVSPIVVPDVAHPLTENTPDASSMAIARSSMALGGRPLEAPIGRTTVEPGIAALRPDRHCD